MTNESFEKLSDEIIKLMASKGVLAEKLGSGIFSTIDGIPISIFLNHLNRGIHVIQSRILLQTGKEFDFASFASGECMAKTHFTRIYPAPLPKMNGLAPVIGEVIFEVIGYYGDEEEFKRKLVGFTNDIMAGYRFMNEVLEEFRREARDL